MRRPRPFAFLVAVLLVIAAGPALAQPMTPEAALDRLVRAEQADPAWFTDAFLAEVPTAEIDRIVGKMAADLGAFQGMEGDGRNFVLHYERGDVPTVIGLAADGRIEALFFGAATARADSLEELRDAIAALPGRTALLVMRGDDVLAEHEADTPLAVGSAAKLAILKTLNQAVTEGRLGLDTVVTLEEQWRSLPTGILQNWPDATPLTIGTLANLMISISDNTATDALIGILGRERIEANSPRNVPFLTTAEFFRLKGPDGAALFRDYLAAGGEARRALLPKIDALPLPRQLRPEVTSEVEWFLTAKELCGLLSETAGHPALAINPGLAGRPDWSDIAFKGGSEPGVLNYSTRLVDKAGTPYCIVATWNNGAALDDTRLATPYRGIVQFLLRQATAPQ